MEMSKEIKKKKEFKDTKLAGFIRNRVYAHRRFKKKYRDVLDIWKKLNLLCLLSLLTLTLSGIFGMSIYRWFFLGEY